jgi:VCBS repeat-containing protein
VLELETGNQAPVADATVLAEPMAARLGEAFRFVIPDTAFADPEGETLTYSLSTEDGSALPDWLNFDAATRTLSGTPPADSTPTRLSFTLTATDPEGLSARQSFVLELETGNQAPVGADDVLTTAKTGVVNTPVAGGVLANDSDPDSTDSLSVTAVNGETAQVGVAITLSGGGTLTLNADGSYRFDPGTAYQSLKTGETATESVRYTLADGRGGTADATLTLTIQGSNSAPSLDPDKTVYIDQYTDHKPTAGNRYGLSITDPVDREGDSLSVQIDAVPTQGAVSKSDGTVVLGGTLISQNDLAGLHYSPAADATGDMGQISYSVSDGVAIQQRAIQIHVNPVQYLDISPDQTVVPEGNDGTTFAGFTLVRSGDSSRAATVDWSLARDTTVDAQDFADGTPLSGTIRFEAGETRQSLSFEIKGDGLVEPSESLRVQIDRVTVIPAGGPDSGAFACRNGK